MWPKVVAACESRPRPLPRPPDGKRGERDCLPTAQTFNTEIYYAYRKCSEKVQSKAMPALY